MALAAAAIFGCIDFTVYPRLTPPPATAFTNRDVWPVKV